MSVETYRRPAVTARVGLDVVGWNASQSDGHEDVARDVRAYAGAAVLAGLDGDEIAFDIRGRWGDVFSEVFVEVGRGLRSCTARVFAVAAPLASVAHAAPAALI